MHDAGLEDPQPAQGALRKTRRRCSSQIKGREFSSDFSKIDTAKSIFREMEKECMRFFFKMNDTPANRVFEKSYFKINDISGLREFGRDQHHQEAGRLNARVLFG